MVYIVSLAAIVLIGLGTILWRIRTAEQQEHAMDDDSDETPPSEREPAAVFGKHSAGENKPAGRQYFFFSDFAGV